MIRNSDIYTSFGILLGEATASIVHKLSSFSIGQVVILFYQHTYATGREDSTKEKTKDTQMDKLHKHTELRRHIQDFSFLDYIIFNLLKNSTDLPTVFS